MTHEDARMAMTLGIQAEALAERGLALLRGAGTPADVARAGRYFSRAAETTIDVVEALGADPAAELERLNAEIITTEGGEA